MAPCNVCEDIWQTLIDPNAVGKSIVLGSLDEALASQCPEHTRIVKAFHADLQDATDNDSDDSLSDRASNDVGFVRQGDDRRLTFTESVQTLEPGRVGRRHGWELYAVRKDDVDDHVGTGRILDPNWIDLDIAAGWKKECLRSHKSKCENSLKVPYASPALLLDVKKQCLVPGAGIRPYVTLSYRWSSEALNKPPIAELQEEGALGRVEILARIPQKIRHAMSVVHALGERYLWADFLCFDYSDPGAIARQLDSMSAFYANALFTIVVADEGGEPGINGLRGVSSPRQCRQKVFPIANEHIMVSTINTYSLVSEGEYHTRGWTHQEFVMSTRKLIFKDGEVHWQCSCSSWHEELAVGIDYEFESYIDDGPLVLSSGFPDLETLGDVLREYNSRNLTYDEDAPAAVAGLLSAFSRAFSSGFLYGLPELMFDRALTWQPYSTVTTLRRRKVAEKLSHLQFAAADLPTWSWLAWQGKISFSGYEAIRMYERNDCMQETTPITEWYTSSAPSGQPRRRIRSSWYDLRDQRKDVSQPLLKGWSGSPAPVLNRDIFCATGAPILYPDGCGQYVYRHERYPGSNIDKWYYPFDISDAEPSRSSFNPVQTRYLFCKTWKTRVFSCRERAGRLEAGSNVVTLRKSMNDENIGSLRLQTDEQMAMWPELGTESNANTPSHCSGRDVDLVAINRVVKQSLTYSHKLYRFDHPITREESITVLWVEWENGIAYRLSCGHIRKAAWDTLVLEDIDLVLG